MGRLASGRISRRDEQRWEKWIEEHVQPRTKIKDLPDELIGYLGGPAPNRVRVLLHLVVWLMAEEYGQKVYQLEGKQVAGKAEQVKFALIFESLRRKGLVRSYPGMNASLTRFVSGSPPEGPVHLCGGGNQKEKLRMIASPQQREWLKQQLAYWRGDLSSARGRSRTHKPQERR